MEITEIRKKEGTKDIYEVYIDGVLAFECREIDLFKFGIYKKRKITKEELEKLLKELRIALAKSIAIKFVMFRKRTSFELRDKLRGFDKNIVDIIVDELQKQDYINDKDYMNKYIVENQRLNNWSVNKIKTNLMRKGFKIDDIDFTISEMGYDEVEKAENMIDKILKSDILPKNFEQVEKIKKYLYNRGFSFDSVEKAMKDYNERER